jgi:uncharacterized protein involved in exopolysaccharide biosynthesis/Mrp family chromosome partitioning ATPase
MQSAAMTPYSAARPVRRQAPPPVLYEPDRPGDDGIDIRGLLDILRRRWRTVLVPAVLLTALALAYVLITPKLYTSSAMLLLDPRDQRVLEGGVLSAGSGSDAALVESQARVITSDAVLGRVVESLGLGNVAEFGGASEDPVKRAASALDLLGKRVAASRADRTYVLEIKTTARDPQLARQIADAVTLAYIADQNDSARAATRRANEALTARLTELRDQLREAEDKIQAYRAANGLVGRDGSATTEQQLAELNQRLVEARARLASAKARYDQMQRSDAASSSEALASPVVAVLREQLSDAMRREADLSATLGDRHPSVVKVRAEVASLQAQMNAEIGRIAASARNDLAIAEGDVAGLQAELDRLTGRDVKDAGVLIQLRELQREADVIREVYESVLARAKETSEQERLDVSSARVIAPATTPAGASFPPRLFIIGIALALGLGAGAALALMRERFDDRIRDAAQLRRAGLEVLAVVPPFGSRRRGPDGGFDYAIRLLRAELRDPAARQAERSALVVSGRKGDGAAAVALNLALAAVGGGERVLIVDADPVRRSLSKLVAPQARVGLMEVLAGKAHFRDALIGHPASGFQVLPMALGSEKIRGRPSRAAYERLVALARTKFDYILFVGAPLSDEPDARAIAEAVDQIALVLRAGSTRRADLEASLRALRIRGQKTCGIVLTMAGTPAAA